MGLPHGPSPSARSRVLDAGVQAGPERSGVRKYPAEFQERVFFMAINNAYLNGVYEDLAARYAEQHEYLEAVNEVLETLVPVVESDPPLEK